ncbi:MAG TPA: hypothetical protein P5234_15925 [Thermoanaerobaculaceae bacterium]|nr:hypothetical protein [Thermoanaerobaculaceae bacterium]HRU10661.1 hypothetical protein [Thermoanaerobaculia bacterium]
MKLTTARIFAMILLLLALAVGVLWLACPKKNPPPLPAGQEATTAPAEVDGAH